MEVDASSMSRCGVEATVSMCGTQHRKIAVVNREFPGISEHQLLSGLRISGAVIVDPWVKAGRIAS